MTLDYLHPLLEDRTPIFFNQRSEPYKMGVNGDTFQREYAVSTEFGIEFVPLSEKEDWQRRREDDLATRVVKESKANKFLPWSTQKFLGILLSFPLRPNLMIDGNSYPVFNDRKGEVYVLVSESEDTPISRCYVVGAFKGQIMFANLPDAEIAARIEFDNRWEMDLPPYMASWEGLCSLRRTVQ